jgi:hypothetical protein
MEARSAIGLVFFISILGCEVASGAVDPIAPEPAPPGSKAEGAGIEAALEELAEQERSSGFAPGLGLAESSLREKAGDYAGATMAAFKELSYAYAVGAASAETVRERLAATGAAFAGRTDPGAAAAVRAVACASDFFAGKWKAAGAELQALFPGEAEREADSFPRWMMLVCALESGGGDRNLRSAYGAVRARYALFPAYWHRAARAAERAGSEGTTAVAEAAERCVSLSPAGPYADEARGLIAESIGLKKSDGKSIRSRMEIEAAARIAGAERNPQVLDSIIPVLSLPDNPYTLYALGVLRGLAEDETIRKWLSARADAEVGRTRERLRYASRR